MSTKSYEEYWSQLKSSSAHHPANRLRYHLIRQAIRDLPLINQGSVLDVGCGDGSLLKEISTLASWKTLAGLDVSENVIAQNQAQLPFRFSRRDAGSPLETQAPLDPAQYDLVLSSEVIEHVENDRVFIQNLARVCKPSGFIILTTQAGPRYRMDREVLGHLRHYTRDGLSELITQGGFKLISLRRAGFPWLNLQKKAVDLCFDQVKRSVLEAETLSPTKRLAMDALTMLYRVSVPQAGPQLIAVAQKT